MGRAPKPRGTAVGWLAVMGAALLLASAGCTERRAADAVGPLPVQATAYPAATDGGRVARDAPEDIQGLTVTIQDGRFGADRYDTQARATRVTVVADGGPYTLSIENLLQPRVVPPNTTTVIGMSVPQPGEYEMRLDGGDRAVLNVRAAGAR